MTDTFTLIADMGAANVAAFRRRQQEERDALTPLADAALAALAASDGRRAVELFELAESEGPSRALAVVAAGAVGA